jgi:hypothetical protein
MYAFASMSALAYFAEAQVVISEVREVPTAVIAAIRETKLNVEASVIPA